MARHIGQIVDEQIRRWNIERQERERTQKTSEFVPSNVITFSVALGSRGIEIAHSVGNQLQIPVYDRQIVEHIATTKHVQIETVQTLDERAQGRIDDYLTNLFRERNFDQSDYFQALTRTIIALWGHGPCVFIGRGAVHMIPRKRTLSVRVVAPMADRVRRTENLEGLTHAQAQRLVERNDAERESFIRKYFGAQIDDPLSYDLVINSVGLDTQGASSLVLDAFRHKFSPSSTLQLETDR